MLPEHYQRPGWFTTHLFNPPVAGLTRVGISLYGSRVLDVGAFFAGVGSDSTDDELRRTAADHPVSRLQIS